MAVWAKRWEMVVRFWAVAALFGFLSLGGCGKQPVPSEQANDLPQPAPLVADKAGSKTAGSENKNSSATIPFPQDGKHESFTKVTRGGDDPPPNSNPPPDVTVSGKPVYKIYKEVLALWDT
ncbi:MAG TPA: hypothetical protein VMF69_06820, partial [Gemmataceae bacterium]|nr:hypothetical protein [Gemmataceae bacterium]